MASDKGSCHVRLKAGQMMDTWLLADQEPAFSIVFKGDVEQYMIRLLNTEVG